MQPVGTLEDVFFDQKKYNVPKKLNQKLLTLMTFFLWISPGLGDDKPPDSKAKDLAFCSSALTYLKDKCSGNNECILDLCSYLYPQVPPRDLEMFLNLPSDGRDEFRSENKRGILNKNVAYLLLKLHPLLNKTSQFGFLTSGRFRRITGNFGTEFLGKRFNNRPTGSSPPGRNNQNLPKPKPTPKFYSLPLDKFAKSKVLKRDDGVPADFLDSREKRISLRGNGKIILGSEFLGKRGFYQIGKIRRFSGTELLGKQDEEPFDGSEFLGKREAYNDFSGKTQHDPVSGTELLGKKSSLDSSEEFQVKRLGNELLGKRMIERNFPEKFISSRRDPDFKFWFDYYPKLMEEVLYSDSFQVPKVPFGSHFCRENDSGICRRLKIK